MSILCACICSHLCLQLESTHCLKFISVAFMLQGSISGSGSLSKPSVLFPPLFKHCQPFLMHPLIYCHLELVSQFLINQFIFTAEGRKQIWEGLILSIHSFYFIFVPDLCFKTWVKCSVWPTVPSIILMVVV